MEVAVSRILWLHQDGPPAIKYHKIVSIDANR